MGRSPGWCAAVGLCSSSRCIPEIVRLSDREDPQNSVQIVLSMIWKSLLTAPRSVAHLLALAVAMAVPSFAHAAQSSNRYDSFRFGVCYYPEQWPESYWE